MGHEVRNNPGHQRYELVIDNRIVSIAQYHLAGDTVVVPHVETDPELRGRGMADLLMRGMLDSIRSEGRTIRPLCGFASQFIRASAADQDLVA